jgi:neutral ceramidase
MVENLSSKIGFSAMKITPEQDLAKIPLGGYYVRYATGVHDDIYVRTIYMAANEEILIIACDLLALFRKFIKRMKTEIHRYTGVKDTNILICALHDHSAPDTLGLEGFRGLVKYTLRGDWFPRIERTIVRSAIDAKKSAKPRKIGVQSEFLGQHEKLVINRRHPRQEMKYNLSTFKVSEDERICASIINYACHGTTLNRENRLISAEYPGYLIRRVEKALEPHFSMYLNGPCGDINPYLFPERWDFEKIDFESYLSGDYAKFNALCSFKHTERIGERLAAHALELLGTTATREIEKIQVLTQQIELPVSYTYPKMSFRDRLGIWVKNGLLKLLGAYNRSNINYFSYLHKNGNLVVQTDLQLILINKEILIIAVPAELFSELGEEIIKKSPVKHTIIVELANDAIGYVFPLKECEFGGYEVFGLASFAGITAGTFLKNKIVKLFRQLNLD